MKMTKTQVDAKIIRAVKAAAEDAGSEAELARKSGVNRPTLNMLSNGKTKSITRANWEKLLPFLAPYLKVGDNAVFQRVDAHAHHNGTVNVVNGSNQISDSCLSAIIDKILAADELTAEEKIKVIKVLKK
jgi:DNA-binding Xre family transcriptional regulator